MAKKGEKLKWNTPKGTTLETLRKRVSGEKDRRGRSAGEQTAVQATRAAGRAKSLKRKSAK